MFLFPFLQRRRSNVIWRKRESTFAIANLIYLGYINKISNIWNIKKKPIFLSRRLEESEKKRQAMMQAMKEQASKKGPNFTITRKDLAVRIHNTD